MMCTLVLDCTGSLHMRHFLTRGEQMEQVATWVHGPEQRVALIVRTHHALRQAVVVSTHITVCVFLLVGVELVVRYAGRKHIKQLVVWCAEKQAGKVLLHRACAGFLSGSALQQNTFWRLTFKYQSFSPTRF